MKLSISWGWRQRCIWLHTWPGNAVQVAWELVKGTWKDVRFPDHLGIAVCILRKNYAIISSLDIVRQQRLQILTLHGSHCHPSPAYLLSQPFLLLIFWLGVAVDPGTTSLASSDHMRATHKFLAGTGCSKMMHTFPYISLVLLIVTCIELVLEKYERVDLWGRLLAISSEDVRNLLTGWMTHSSAVSRMRTFITLKIAVLCFVAPYSLDEVHGRFRDICSFHHHSELSWWWRQQTP